jgi:hypothetical protein
MSSFQKIILILLFLYSILWVSDRALKDEVAEQKHYCDMVRTKAWPDFRPEINCKITEDFFND